MIWIAVAVDTALYAALGFAIVRLGRHKLPDPWNKVAFTVPLVVTLGLLVTLATFQSWLVYPR